MNEENNTPCHHAQVLLVSAVVDRATTPIATPASCPATTTRAFGSSALALGRWRRSNKGVVNLDCLVEQFRTVESFDGGAGFGKGRVLDQRVSLCCDQKVSLLDVQISIIK